MMEFQVGSPGFLHLAVAGRSSVIPLGISLDQASLEWGPHDTSKQDGWVSGRSKCGGKKRGLSGLGKPEKADKGRARFPQETLIQESKGSASG